MATEETKIPLHLACSNRNVTPGIILSLLNCWPDAVNHQDNMGELPIHILCQNGFSLDEEVSLDILRTLVEESPSSVQRGDGRGLLPIHHAIKDRTPGFCKALIHYYPESLKVRDFYDALPIHHACIRGNVETVRYLLEVYPESSIIGDSFGSLPIHWAAMRGGDHQVEYMTLLLETDSTCASKATYQNADQPERLHRLPLHLACKSTAANFDAVKLLFDAYPEAILSRDSDGATPIGLLHDKGNRKVKPFLVIQLGYARKARDAEIMSTKDRNGWLPLHQALRYNATLGSTKLLMKGNPSALSVFDNQGTPPLHIACRHSSADVVEYLLALDDTLLKHCDPKKNSTLHYACQGGNCEVVKLLLEMSVPAVSERNTDNKLPIQLLLETNEGKGSDRSSPEYVEAVWVLLLAHPSVLS